LAFKYRKREPGSGGRRPGAGRRPDVSPTLRRFIGELYAREHRSERERYFFATWFEELFSLWDGIERSSSYKQSLYDQFLSDPGLRLDRQRFIQKMIFNPEGLINENGEPNFGVESMRPIAEAFSALIGGPALSYDHLTPLPRKQIMVIRRKALSAVRAKVPLTPVLSDVFIVTCWKAMRL